MTGLLSSRKGQAAENIMRPILFLFVFAILTIIGTLISLAIIDAYKTAFPGNDVIQAEAAKYEAAFNIFDYIIFIIAVLFIIGIAITSYRLSVHPVFFALTFIMSVFIGALAYIFSYIFSQIVSQSVFNTVIARYSMTVLLLTNLHWVALGLIIVGAVALFGKRPKEIETLR